MEILFECLFEFLADFVVEILAVGGEALLGNKRQLSKAQKQWLRFGSAVVSVATILCLVLGIVWLCTDGASALNITLTAIGGGLLLLWLVLIVITWGLRRRRCKVAAINTDTTTESV